MKVVIFLGAGFSAPYGLPTMNSFLNVVDRSKRLSPEQRAFVYELLRESRQANSFLRSSPTNLEDMLSFAVMGDRLSIPGFKGQPRGTSLALILRTIFSAIEAPLDLWRHADHLKAFLGPDFFSLGNEASFVTTNYDVMVDCAVHRLGKGLSLGFDYGNQGGAGERQVDDLYATKGLALFKLHGSVNWFSVGDSVRVDGRILEVAQGSRLATMPACSLNEYSLPGEPIIVPPTFAKPELRAPLLKVWSGAARALQEAHLIIFVGYSFPSSDIEMKYFLARALTDNLGIRRIVVVDPAADAIRERLMSSGSGFGNHFQQMLVVENIGSWQQTSLPGYMAF